MKKIFIILKNEKAQGSFEFALVAPVFLLIFFSIIEFGWTAYQKTVFLQGFGHASYDITGERLRDHNSLKDADISNITTYTVGVDELIKDSIEQSCFWGFIRENLTVTNAKAVLENEESNTVVPSFELGETANVKTITRYAHINADITYNIYPITGLGNLFFGNKIELKKHLNCKRVVSSQQRLE